MSEENVTPTEHRGLTKEELEERFAAHRREMEDRFHEERQELLDELAATSESDKAEREEIRRQLKEHDEYVKTQLAAQKQREEMKGDKHTIVVPPSQIPPPPRAPSGNSAPTKAPKKGWKKVW